MLTHQNSQSRCAGGDGSIRKITTKQKGKTYTYWQARYTVGYDPGTGKQIQKSITGKTQDEVRQKLKDATHDIDHGTYIPPNKITVGKWLDTWVETYLGDVKPRTLDVYKSDIRLHLKPALGAVRLEALDAPTIQAVYNNFRKPTERHPNGLSAKTIKNVHGVLHKALKQAVLVGYIRSNPSDHCILPRVEKKNFTPLDDFDIAAFVEAIKNHRFQTLFTLTLFTGLREGEVLGLTWDCVDFLNGTITVNKQLQLHDETKCNAYELVSTKNGKARSIAVAPSVTGLLKLHRTEQMKQRLLAGAAWENHRNLVFTDETGRHLVKATVYREYKKVVSSIGRPDARFHDLRHSYAVAAIRSGDDIKTIQGNLGHATASFTLDVYGHVTMQMKRESADRMEAFISKVCTL